MSARIKKARVDYCLRVDNETRRAIRLFAVEHDMSAGAVVEELVSRFLGKLEEVKAS